LKGLKVYISAPREKRFFIECVKEIIEQRGDKWFYPPDESRDLDDKQILDKVMKELWFSNLVLMDVSMKCFDDKCYPNSGVMIEFGLLMNASGKEGIHDAYLFCDDRTDRSRLPPMIPRVEVEQYSENEENRENFKKIIQSRLEDFQGKIPERYKKALEAKDALATLLGVHTERFSTQT
jgi:hypothetical protein